MPGLNNQGPTWIISPKIFQGLLRYAADLKPLPNLAKSWTVSDDGATSTYVRASLSEVAAALAALTGEPHPLAEPDGGAA